MPFAPGTRLGPYEITGAIGAGGMGEVYRARDTKLDRTVAIKVLPDLFATDPERLARFEREAKTLASLNHPNIAHIYGQVELPPEDGSQIVGLVMECVEGEDLSARIARGAIPLNEALAIAKQIADGLAAAHECGVVHRDLKPGNIKLREDGTVKVLDFGLAKLHGPAEAGRYDSGGAGAGVGRGFSPGALEHSPTFTSPAMTQLGVILGTAAYMAPEQAKGKVVDRRADVWAFGVVLFEMLAGRQLFAGEDVSDTLAAVLTREPDWTTLPAATPQPVRRLLRRCLARDPRLRLDSMAAARLDIEDALTAPADTAAPAAPLRASPWRRALVPAAACLAGAVVAGVVLWRLMQPVAPVVQRFSIMPPPDVPLQIETNHPDLAIAPNGSYLLYWTRVKTANSNQFVVRPFDQFEGRVLQDMGTLPRGAFVSPDGAHVAYQAGGPSGRGGSLMRAPVTGGAPAVICPLEGNLRGGTWLRDGTIVYSHAGRSAGGLLRVRAAGGTPEVLTTPKTDQQETAHRWPEILPDGRHVLFQIGRPRSGEPSDIGVLSLDTKTWRVLVKGGTYARYSPTGHIVYADSTLSGGKGGTLRAVGFNLGRVEVTSDPVPVVSGVLTKESGAADFAISDTGTLVYIAGTHSAGAIPVWKDRSGATTPIAVERRDYRSLAVSPDGRYIAAIVGGVAAGSLWLIDMARETVTRLTPQDMMASNPAWSPDSQRIAFGSPPPAGGGGRGGIFQISVRGTGVPERLTEGERGAQLPASWSPDGRHLIFNWWGRDATTAADIFQFTAGAAPAVTPLISGPGLQLSGVISPNGRWLAHMSDDSGTIEVYLRPWPNVNDERIPVSSGGGTSPAWRSDGRELYFGRGLELFAVSVETTPKLSIGKPRKILDLETRGEIRRINPSPDGLRFLIASDDDGAVSRANEYRVVVNWFEELKKLMRDGTK